MDTHTNKNSKQYLKWLIASCAVGGLAGWIVQGMLQGYLLWSLPLFFLVALGFTINGDNIIESLVVLLILGALAFMLWRIEAVSKMIGFGTLLGAYTSLVISKFGLTLGKEGALGNNPFN